MSAVVASGKLTLVDVAKSIDPNGNMATVAEILNQDNPIIQDAPWIMANNLTSHRITRRLSLPGATWRRFNEVVAANKGTKIQVDEPMGMLTAYSEADKDLVDLYPNPAQARMDEARSHIEGMSQELAGTLFYGNNGTDPEEFDGLAVRLGSIDATNLVRSAGGSSTLSSVYIVQWGIGKVYMVYPRSHKTAGIVHEPLGEQTKETTSGLMQVYRDRFVVHCGLAVADSRCLARLANIDTTAAAGASYSFDEDDIIKMLNRMPMEGAGSVIYVHAEIKSQMEIKLKDKANVNFTTDVGLGGVPVLRFRGLPVKVCQGILTSETAIT
jgi:hypothetical protein